MRRISRAFRTAICAVADNVVAERGCLLSQDTAPAVNNLLDQIVAKIPQ